MDTKDLDKLAPCPCGKTPTELNIGPAITRLAYVGTVQVTDSFLVWHIFDGGEQYE